MAGPLDGLDLNLLITLRALLREGSVSRAAETLGSTQPTVSRALATLRTAFGDPLLVRAGRAMQLTPRGEALRVPVERALRAIDRLRAVGEFDPRTAQRTFRLIIPDVIGVWLVPHLHVPDSNLAFEVHSSERQALDMLLHDETDVLVTALSMEHPDLDHAELERPMNWRVVYGPKHPAWDSALDFDAWLHSDHLQLIPAGRSSTPSRLDALLHERDMRRRVMVRVTHLSTAGPALRERALMTSLPAPAAKWLEETHGLRSEPHPFDALQPLPLRLTWHVSQTEDEGHRWLREHVTRAMG